MADGSITLNPGIGGDILDTETIDRADGATVERERIVIAGPGVEQYLDINESGAAAVRLEQSVDAGNTQVVSSAEASPGSPWIGSWTSTRDLGIVRLLTVLASSSAAVGGTFTFEFSETGAEVGLGTAPISETRPIGDFDTVRDFDLINAGAYYRVAFEPATALGAELVFVTTTLRRQNDGAFVRLANQEIEEANAAMGQTFVYPKAFLASTGKSINIRADELGSMYVVDERQVVTQSGSSFTESIRDDISISFDADEGALEITRKVEDEGNSSPSASISHDTTEGQVVIATGGVAGAVAYYQSQKRLIYEAGHELAGEQTIEVDTTNLTGDAMVEWGLAISDGSGNTYNHVGYRLTAAGLFAVRKKNGVDQSVVAQTAFNRDKLDGGTASRYRLAGEPVALNLANNSLWRVAFEWLGIAPPTFKIMVPAGVIVPVHVEETPGQQTGTTVPSPRLRLFVRAKEDTGGAGEITVRSGSWRGGIHTSKVVSTAAQPDGDYVDERADGLAQDRTGTDVEFTTPLAPSGVVVSDWVDTDGWNQLEILVTTDQVSATSGIQVEFTDDTSAITPSIRATQMFTFTAADVALGYATYPIPVTSDGFRIRYTNGGIAQTDFYMGVTLRKPSRPHVQRMQTGQIELTDPGSINWNRIYGYTDAGTFVSPGISDDGGQRIAILEHEVTTPPAASSTMDVRSGTATATPAVALSTAQAITGRTAVILVNRDGTRELRYATSTASLNGGIYAALPPNAGVVLPINPSVEVAVATGSGTAAYSVTQVAELQAAI